MRAGATHCPPSSSSSPSRSPSPHLPSATASPSSSPHRPLPHLHLHSCPRTRTLILTSLHCARRCRLLGASVGAISSLCDAAVSGAHRARLLCARRGYLVGRSRSAALRQRYSGRPPGRRSPPALAPAGPGSPRAECRQFRARDCRWACGADRATIDRPPRLPPKAWSRSCLKRRPDPARRSRPRPGDSRVTVLGRTKRH